MAGDRIKKELAQRRKLQKNLERDLAEHGDPEQHKRLGDLLLANIGTAVRNGDQVTIKDYYSEGEPELVLEVDKDSSLQDEAGRYFSRYTKAKRAALEISARLAALGPELLKLKERQAELERIIASGDEAALLRFEGPVKQLQSKTRKKPDEKFPGVRRYLSSDDYEILVGRAAQTNDRLTSKSLGLMIFGCMRQIIQVHMLWFAIRRAMKFRTGRSLRPRNLPRNLARLATIQR